ncbi:hypothetical protein GBAR_LOCUS6838 [Geodia barretti]|uniref:Uncharacterized protein n=1 Tax=Geodia barretti TaxID=519541 RepID=A0AA35W7N8_GEOBA|nr:hypothetical protein GBAR_LOCUS6838 [Geodia barretti]
MTQAIEAVNVTWPRFRVLSNETVYKLIIDDEEVVSDVSEENCGREMCGYVYRSNSLTSSSTVAVDVVGCVTQRINPENLSSLCSPEDLLFPGVDWTAMPDFTADGMGVYSFPGGNVTYNGVSLGSTATYNISEEYIIDGVRSLERRCENNGSWTHPDLVIMNASSTANYTTTNGYCIPSDFPPERTCGANLSWSGEIPTIKPASPLKQLSTADIVLIALGLLLFLAGVVISIVVVVLSWPQGATKEGGKEALKRCCRLCILSCCCPCWIRCVILMMLCPPLILAIVLPGLEAIPWVASFIYAGINEFTVDGGDYRDGNSLRKSPSGSNAVRDGLFSASFVISLLIFLFWLVYLSLCDIQKIPLKAGET